VTSPSHAAQFTEWQHQRFFTAEPDNLSIERLATLSMNSAPCSKRSREPENRGRKSGDAAGTADESRGNRLLDQLVTLHVGRTTKKTRAKWKAVVDVLLLKSLEKFRRNAFEHRLQTPVDLTSVGRDQAATG